MNTEDSLQHYKIGPAQLWTAKPNGELDWVNQSVLEYFGRTFEQMIEWGWTEVLHEDDYAPCGEKWSASLESGTPYEIQFRLKRHDGEFIWHIGRATPQRNDNGDIVRWVGANMDIHAVKTQA